MPHQIILDEHKFTIIHRSNKRIKKISLVLENKNEILLKTPLGMKSHMLKQIVVDHKDWILRSLYKVPSKNQFDFITGGKVPFLGVDYPMNMEQNDKIKNVKFSMKDGCFLVQYNSSKQSYEDFMEGLKKFYKINAQKTIDPIFDEWTFKTKMFPNKIGYRYAKTRWGSCNMNNDISINYKLLQFEKKVIEYVVLHELCHIKEKNHSKRFWNLVSLYMPEYKDIEKKIKSKLF